MNVGFIAHDSKKYLMQNFCIAYRGILSKHTLFATGSTGRLISEVTGLNIHKFLEGGLGGEQQLASQIENNNLDVIFFFRDPENCNPRGSINLKNIMILCDQYNIPLATNLATAELLVKSLGHGDLEWREAYHS